MKSIADYLPKESEQHWANGCEKCKFGFGVAPELTGAIELHLERLVQYLNGEIVFCDCQAGTRYEVYLKNLRQKLIEEARKDKRMVKWAMNGSHPVIDWAKAKMAVRVDYVPLVHGA